jgi:hypothetical protein
MNYKECPICHKLTSETFAVRWDAHAGKNQALDWLYYRCTQCGCHFLDSMRQWTPEMFASRIYNADYILTDPAFGETRSRNILPILLYILQEHHCRRILDYGGGNGALTDMLRARGFTETYCYDPYGRQDVTATENGFNAVIAIEVLEHVIDAFPLWYGISARLNRGGIFIATTETYKGQKLEDWTYANPRAGHTLIYTETALRRIANSVGLVYIPTAWYDTDEQWHLFMKA